MCVCVCVRASVRVLARLSVGLRAPVSACVLRGETDRQTDRHRLRQKKKTITYVLVRVPLSLTLFKQNVTCIVASASGYRLSMNWPAVSQTAH